MGVFAPALLGYAAQLPLDKLKSLPISFRSAGRQLSHSYRGPMMLVRRSSDNATDAIGYKNGLLDSASLLAFCGSGDGFVQTWYEQGALGSTGDATQTTAANQPQIVSAGSIMTQGGKPALYFVTGEVLLMTGLSNQLVYSAFTVSNVNNASSQGVVLGGNGFAQFIRHDGSGYPHVFFGADNASSSSLAGSTFRLLDFIGNGTTVVPYANGSALNAITLTSESPQIFQNIGGYSGAGNFAGYISEIEYFSSVLQPTDKTFLDFNRAAFYGISGVTA